MAPAGYDVKLHQNGISDKTIFVDIWGYYAVISIHCYKAN